VIKIVHNKPHSVASKKKIAAGVTGKKNGMYKDGRRSYRRIAGAKPGDGKVIHHCYSLDTEYLTVSGWKKLMDINFDDIIFQVNDKLEWSLIKANPIFVQANEGIEFKSPYLDLYVTTDHTMLTNKGAKKANNLLTGRYWCYGACNENNIINCSEKALAYYRFLTAIVCDGIICMRSIRFNLSKKYKIKRIKELLNILNIKYKIRILTPKQHQSKLTKNNITEININNIKLKKNVLKQIPNKELPYKWLTLANNARNAILDEYLLFDGSTCKNNIWTSKNEKNINILQALGALSGRVLKKYNYPQFNNMFKLIEKKNNKIPIYNGTIEKINMFNCFGCLTTTSGFLIVRRNGIVSISGNSNENRNNNKKSNLIVMSEKKHKSLHMKKTNKKGITGRKKKK